MTLIHPLILTAADSGKVVVWNMAPVVSKRAEADENIPKMLCQMDNHEGKRIPRDQYFLIGQSH